MNARRGVGFLQHKANANLDASLRSLQHLHQAGHERLQERHHRFWLQVLREHLQHVARHALLFAFAFASASASACVVFANVREEAARFDTRTPTKKGGAEVFVVAGE